MQRIYAKSSKAKDCREVVANYNAARGAIHEQEYQLEEELPEYNEQENQDYDEEHVRTDKWKEFVKADEDEEDFTIAAPAVVLKPKLASKKRAIDHDSEGGPSNSTKHAREFNGGGGGEAFLKQPPLATARTHVEPVDSTRVDTKQYAEDYRRERVLLDSNLTAMAAAAEPAPLPAEIVRTEPAFQQAPPPPQQAGKKWGSFVDNNDVW